LAKTPSTEAPTAEQQLQQPKQQKQQQQPVQQQQPKKRQQQPKEKATWSEVVKRKKKGPSTTSSAPPARPPSGVNSKLVILRQRAPKTAAVTIDRPADGGSLAAVMKKVAGTINLGALGVRVLTTRRTRAGGILLEVEGEEKAAPLEGKIWEVAGDAARVRRPEWAEPEDVVSGLDGAGIVVDATTVLIRKNNGRRGDVDRVARVDLPFRDAIALAVVKAVEVGWTRCRVKLLEKKQSTCFQCPQKGHLTAECRNEAKPRACFDAGPRTTSPKIARGRREEVAAAVRWKEQQQLQTGPRCSRRWRDHHDRRVRMPQRRRRGQDHRHDGSKVCANKP